MPFLFPDLNNIIHAEFGSRRQKLLNVMKKNKNNEELQSRREFFKKAAKGALPILSAVAMISSPIFVRAAETSSIASPMGCNRQDCTNACIQSCSSCTGSCRGTCSGRCSSSCAGSCSGNCTERCANSCSWSCVGSCSKSCLESCSGACSGRCTGTCYGLCYGTCEGSCRADCANSNY